MIERNLGNHTTNDINLITNLLNRQHEQIKEFYEFEKFLLNELGFEKYRKLRDTFAGMIKNERIKPRTKSRAKQ